MKATSADTVFQQPLESTRGSKKEKPTMILASIGLFIGGVFGMAGTFAPSASLRGLAWGVDGTALIVAGALLVVCYFRKGYDVTAAGFLIFIIGEALILSCTAMDLDANASPFGAGTGLWAASLAVISSQKLFPVIVRCAGFIAAMLFAVVSVQIFTGHSFNGLTKPLPFYAYPFFVLAIFGWAWKILRPTPVAP
jgi:hypothetical protein